VNIRVGKLVKELETIDKRSFQMALSVHKDSNLRVQLGEEAALLQKRLLSIAEELEGIAPETHKQWSHRISESLLDLNFVVSESGAMSLRLGDIIRWGK
jgi:hypothetical protein